MASMGSDIASDEMTETKCCVCAEKNITRQAEKYCVECMDYYCIPCTDMHKSFPLMKEHKLLDKADFSTHGLRSSLPCFPTERCLIHKAKILDMFCENHDEVVCATCVAMNHRTCQDIHSIPDEVDNLYKQSASDQINIKLRATKKDAENTKNVKQHLLSELKKERNITTNTITKYRKELEAELKRLENESLKEIDAKYITMERELLNDIQEEDQHIKDIEQSATTLQKSNGNKAQEFVCVKTAQKIIATVKHSPSSTKIRTEVNFKFSADEAIPTYLKQLETLGQVTTVETTYKPKTTAYKVKQQRDIDTKLKEDYYLYSTVGSCFTEDGSLLLADSTNEKLKCLDISTDSITDHLDLEARPHAVCLTSKHEAAVSVDNNTIQFVSLGDKMTVTRKLKMEHCYDCYGLAFNDGKLFISDAKKAVYIYDINGTMLHKITTDKSGNSIFSRARHICVSTNKDRVYVTDLDKGLITLYKQGNYMSRFADRTLVWPLGVCTDKRGNVLVCGFWSFNVFQISEDSNTKIRKIKTELRPLSVCIDPNKNLLAVTCQSNTMTLYELE